MPTEYDIAAAFEAIENELIASMMRNMKRHRAEETTEGYAWSQWQAEQLQALSEYKRHHRAKYRKQFRSINKDIETLLREAKRQGGMEQEEAILRAIQQGATLRLRETLDASFFRVNERKLDALIKATTDDIERAETAVLRRANDQYRKIIFNAQVYANTGAGTYEKAVDMAAKDFLSAGIQCVVYANGARHTLSDYAEMAIRTASKRAYLQGEGEKRQEWGISTVILNKRGNACPLCAPFCGKVFIDDVWSGGKAKDGPYPLLSGAIAKGLYHPRCKDSHTTFFPGINEEGSPWTSEERKKLAQDYNREQKRQHAERQAKKYDRLSAYSLDADNRRRYEARAEEWDNLAESGKKIHKYSETIIAPQIKTAAYRRKIDALGETMDVSRSLWENAVRMLDHRNGTKFEDLAFIDSVTGKFLVQREYNVDNQVLPTKKMKKMVRDSEPYLIIAVHNHPGSSVPSIADLITSLRQQYKYGVIACHNGMIFRYKVTKEFDAFLVDMALDRLNDAIYNKNEQIDGILDELYCQGIELEVI